MVSCNSQKKIKDRRFQNLNANMKQILAVENRQLIGIHITEPVRHTSSFKK